MERRLRLLRDGAGQNGSQSGGRDLNLYDQTGIDRRGVRPEFDALTIAGVSRHGANLFEHQEITASALKVAKTLDGG